MQTIRAPIVNMLRLCPNMKYPFMLLAANI